MESQSHSELLAKISILEMKLADAEQRAATADQLAKDIAISADEHVQELERMLEFKITEEQYQQQAINYVKRIDILESELKEQRHETRKAIQDNYELALSAKKHVDEIVGQLLDSERKNERLQILLDSEKKNKSANDRIHQSQPQQSETASLPTESEKARQSIVRVRKGSIFKRQSISIETSSPLALVVIKQGYLQKKSPSFLIGWQSRYFVLRGDLVMLYYAKVTISIRNMMYVKRFVDDIIFFSNQ